MTAVSVGTPHAPGRAGFVRRAGASTGALVAAAAMYSFNWTLPVTEGLAATFLAASALLIHARSAGAQLFSRGLWMSALLLGGVNALFGAPAELGQSLLIMAGTAAALAASGNKGLEEGEATGFAPAGYRRTLMVALAMALADTQSLLFYGVAWLERHGIVTSALLLGSLMTVAAVGLFRLRVWGLLLSLGTSLAIAGSAVAGVLSVPSPVDSILVVTALVQLAVLAPLTRAVLRGARDDEAEERAPSVGARTRVAVGPDPGGDGARLRFQDESDAAEREAALLEIDPRAAPRRGTSA